MGSDGEHGGRPWQPDDPLVLRALAAVARAVPLAVAVLDPDGRVLRCTDAFARLTGSPADRLLGTSVLELRPERPDLVALLEAALGGSGTPEASTRWSVTSARVAEGVAVCVAESRAEMANGGRQDLARLELMSRAAELLVGSLEPQLTLENLCTLLVPELADHVFVDLHDGDVLRRVAVRHADDAALDPLLVRPVGVPAGYAPEHPVRRAFEHGDVLLVPDLQDAGDAVPRGRDTEFLDAWGVVTLMVLPLRAGSRILGTVVLTCSSSGRHYDESDVALVQDLVDHAGRAVANSLRYAEQRTAALELQRALLPRSLHPVEGLDVAWRYVPGTDGTEVGGDWADVLELPGGRVAVVVGDVMGRGLQAAAVMGQLRTAVRALAMQDPPPVDLMTHLDAIVTQLGTEQIVTCVYGVYDPARGTVTVANAGHLPPLLVLDGRCHRLDGLAAVPLGVGGVEFAERVVPLPCGATLALYTDGLVERRERDLEDAVEELGDLLLRARGSLVERCGEVLQQSAPGGPAGFQDDVALLLVQATADPSHVVAQHVLAAVPTSVGEARQATTRTLEAWGLRDEDLHLTGELLVSELVTNAVRYAQGTQVELVLRRGETAVWVEVGDRDTRSPRLRHAGVDDEGGRGLALVQALSDAWGTRTLRDGKVVWVRLDLVPQPGRAEVGRSA